MARPKDEELGEDFSYILRMADTDMDGLKPLATALTSVKGVGHRTATQICKNTGFDAHQLAGFLSLSNKKNYAWPLRTTLKRHRCGWLTGSETSRPATTCT